MFSPKEQQIEICLLKSNLHEIENDLVVQRTALPELAAENEQKYRETMSALHVARALNSEMERLKLENMRLTAKRMQLKKQCEDITKGLDKARETRAELVNTLKEDEQAIESEIRKYEELLREKADRFRKTRLYYNKVSKQTVHLILNEVIANRQTPATSEVMQNEEEMKNEFEIINQNVMKLEIDKGRYRQNVTELQNVLMSLVPDLPKNILEIVGKDDLESKLKSLTDKCAELREIRDRLLKRRKVAFRI